jgi:hypothetical protein
LLYSLNAQTRLVSKNHAQLSHDPELPPVTLEISLLPTDLQVTLDR